MSEIDPSHYYSDEPFDDPENPEWTDEDFARAKTIEELTPELRNAILAAFPKTAEAYERRHGGGGGDGGNGRPGSAKSPVSIRLDQDVLAHFRAGGPGWQTRINQALRAVMESAG